MKRFGKIKYQPDKKSACDLKSNSRKKTTFSPSRTSRKSVKWIMKGGSTTDTFVMESFMRTKLVTSDDSDGDGDS